VAETQVAAQEAEEQARAQQAQGPAAQTPAQPPQTAEEKSKVETPPEEETAPQFKRRDVAETYQFLYSRLKKSFCKSVNSHKPFPNVEAEIH
jgi:hypothetical protein